MGNRFKLAPRTLRIITSLIVVSFILAACSVTRPSVEQWQPTWDRYVDALPDQATVGETPPRSLCNETLVFLRENRGALSPTPDIALDEPVREWIEIAEDAFFECPPRGQKVGSFAEAYALLSRLEAEIDSVLDMDRES